MASTDETLHELPQKADIAIIGAGIVGLATAYDLVKRFADRSVVVLEKEPGPGQHQTGHNSGVLHSGIYYKPGSLKAINCREGRLAMQTFCQDNDIDYDICGKIIVALDESELPAMTRIYERGQANGIRCQLLERSQIDELEPHAAGIAAIHVPDAGIVDYKKVCSALEGHIRKAGGSIVYDAKVIGMKSLSSTTAVQTTQGDLEVLLTVNCAGLYSDRLARLSGANPGSKIVPFRGEYYELKAHSKHLCRNLIYPVPDASFPFLGVHFTRMVNGTVECGPNAVLAFAREGYKLTDVHIGELLESLTYPGFLRMAMKHWRIGLGEMWRSLSKKAFVKALQRLMPEITVDHLVTAPAGVRAQALTLQGDLVDDFLVEETERSISVCNAPSPAATASLNIGRLVVDKIAQRLS